MHLRYPPISGNNPGENCNNKLIRNAKKNKIIQNNVSLAESFLINKKKITTKKQKIRLEISEKK
jgi:hypothetical protein